MIDLDVEFPSVPLMSASRGFCGSLASTVGSGEGRKEVKVFSNFMCWFSCCLVTMACLLFETPWTAACQALLSSSVSRSLLRIMYIESMMPSNHLILCHPLFLLPLIFPSTRVFSSELALHIKWPKYWSFSISPSNEYSGLISFRIDLFT